MEGGGRITEEEGGGLEGRVMPVVGNGAKKKDVVL